MTSRHSCGACGGRGDWDLLESLSQESHAVDNLIPEHSRRKIKGQQINSVWFFSPLSRKILERQSGVDIFGECQNRTASSPTSFPA
jgi:hypothetical protein